MKIYTKLVIGCCVAWATCTSAWADDTMMWYQQPADDWMQALPIGNGRLGAMIYGGVEEETIALNESSMWSGGYNPTQDRPFGKERMRRLQQMALDGRIDEVNRIANDSLTGRTRRACHEFHRKPQGGNIIRDDTRLAAQGRNQEPGRPIDF